MTNFSPLEYLKIDIANHYGKDKEQFTDRIKWVDEQSDLASLANKAEKPYQYMAAVLAYNTALSGEPTGYLVGLDACSSGIAIMGAAINCPVTCKNVGLTGDKRMDMYSECTKAINTILNSDIEIPRKDIKSGQMTHFYGSTNQPKVLFGEGTDALEAFYEAQEIVAPGACKVMQELLMSWQPYALEHSWTMPDGFEAIVPVLQKVQSKIEIDELDGVALQYIYEANIGKEAGLSIAANATHGCDSLLIRELARRANYNREQLETTKQLIIGSMPYIQKGTIPRIEKLYNQHQFLSLVGIEHITSDNAHTFSTEYRARLLTLVESTLSYPSFEVLAIHDEIKCHPNHMNKLREIYRDVMCEFAESNTMQTIIGMVRGDANYILDKYDTSVVGDMKQGNYFLS